MKNMRFTRLILQPSAGGLLGILGLSLLVMLISGLSFVSKSGLLYDYLFGSGSSSSLIETSKSTIAIFSEAFFGNPFLNKVLFFVFWMLIGLIVYLFISGLGAGASEAGRVIEESRFVHAEKQRITSDFRLKLTLRLIALGLIVFYSVLFVKVLLPFGVLCARIVAGGLGDAGNWVYGLLGFLVLSGSFYLWLVLLRFLTLRPRLVGGWEDIIADEIEHGAHHAA
jgi:hypothetical protein